MLLCIDAGNSFVKAAYHDGQSWIHSQRCTLTDFCRDPRQLVPLPAERIVIANVAGKKVVDALQTVFPAEHVEWLQTSSNAAEVVNGYNKPQQLGIDRWCMLIAAHHRVGGPCVIAGVGTALTVDLLSEKGVFLGGVIAPGLDMMRKALAQGTHGVQFGEGRVMETPTNTLDAVETGVNYAIRGVIMQMVQTLEAHGQDAVHYLITGGNASMIAPYLNRPFQVIDNLVLEGVRILALQKGKQ